MNTSGIQDCRFAEAWEALRGEPAHFFPLAKSPYKYERRPEIATVFSYSIANFAMRVFTLGEEERYAEADKAIIRNCRYYVEHRTVRDDRDSYYWSIGLFLRILNKYGLHGRTASCRLGEEAENWLITMMCSYCADHANFNDSEYRFSKTWRVYESENHKLMKDTAIWGQAALLCDYGNEYADRLIGGYTFRVHYERYNEYLKCWLNEHARKSMFIETGSRCYMHETMKSVYNIYELARDGDLKLLARNFLDLFWATWAQEQLGGVHGGGAARMYMRNVISGCPLSWGYYYFGLGHPKEPFYIDNDLFTVLESDYRVPEYIVRLACEPDKRGTYTVEMRPYGLNDWTGPFKPGDYPFLDWGGIYRYSYCTPKYILGCLMSEQLPNNTFLSTSMQNRFQGAVFASHEDAVIYVSPEFIHDDRAYNTCWNEQCEGTLISQECRYTDRTTTGVMRVWLSDAGGLSNIVERQDWLFTRTEGAYAAVRFVNGAYSFELGKCETARGNWHPGFVKCVSGLWARAFERMSPVIVETATDDMFVNFDAFITAVLSCPLTVGEGALRYHSLYGHDFVFGLKEGVDSTIDGEHYVKRLPYSHKSPFVNGGWDDDKVAVTFDGDTHVIDFSYGCEL